MSRELNLQIAAAFGIDTRHVVGFHLRCWVGQAPRLRITKNLVDGASVTLQTDQFDISLRQPPAPEPFDLNTACYRAMVIVRRSIEQSWLDAQDELRDSFNRRLEEIWG